MQRLKNKIAVVTGASRGGGRGIALVLGEEGATVYVTGRSVRGSPTPRGLPETIDETAELVTARGGVGIPVRCDHTVDSEVEALFERVEQEQGHLDCRCQCQRHNKAQEAAHKRWLQYKGAGRAVCQN